ncbi:MAG: porin, partial [Halomonas sp.]
MKKTLLATAIAGSMAATGAQAATIYNEDGTKLDLYGNIQYAYSDVENGDGTSDDGLNDNGTTVGINASHMVTRDLEGYLKLEFEVDQADEIKGTGRGLNDGDQAFIGTKGSFGDLRIGSWDPLIDDWAQDKITNNEFADVSDSSTDLGALAGDAGFNSVDREGDKVQYMSPNFQGFDFGLGFQFKGDGDRGNNANDAFVNEKGVPQS